jgi:hypothetical protein
MISYKLILVEYNYHSSIAIINFMVNKISLMRETSLIILICWRIANVAIERNFSMMCFFHMVIVDKYIEFNIYCNPGCGIFLMHATSV